MDRHRRAYRALHRLYPREFRVAYGDDLVQAFDDLTVSRGGGAAWRRTAVDLLVTVPRYQLERVMTQSHSTTALTLSIGALATIGVLSVLVGVYPGVVLIGVAVVLAVGQRSRLARSIRTPDTDRRRRCFTIAGVLAVVCVVAIVSFSVDTNDGHISDASLLLHNVIGVPAMVGTLAFLALALLTPRAPNAA